MANTKVTSHVIANNAITADQLASAAVTDAKLHSTLDLSGKTLTLPATAIPSASTATTQAASDNSTKLATTAYVETAISNLVDSAPAALDTLNEIAAALGDDANYASTTTAAIASKLPLAGGTLTGNLVLSGAPSSGLHPATKTYTDTADALKLNLSGGTLTGDLILNTTTALKIPVGTNAQRPSAAVGQIRWTTDDGALEVYNGSAWVAVGTGSSNKILDTFTGDNSTTTFALSVTPANEDAIMVFIDGAYQEKGDYVLTNASLALDTAPLSGEKIAVHITTASVHDGTSALNQAFTGDGSTTDFTLSQDPKSENNTQIYINGVYQQKTDYTVTGTTLAFDTAPDTGDIIEVNMFTVATLGNTDTMAEGASNLYHTTARARGAISVSGSALSYNSSTGVITSAYEESPSFTGSVDVAGNITVGNNNTIFAENNIRFKATGASYIDIQAIDQDLIFRTSETTALDTNALRLDGSEGGAATFNSTISSGAITSSGTSTFADVTIGGTGDSQSLIQMLANSTNGANTIHFGDATSGTASYTGYINYAHDTNRMQFATNGGGVRLTIDNSGNVGIGLTPTNFSSRKSLDIGLGGKIWGHTSATETGIGSNFYFDGAYKRTSANAATRHIQDGNGHTFDVAASGSADATISWTTAMTIDPAGNVGFGTASPLRSLDVRHSLSILGTGGYTELMLRSRAGTAQNLGAFHLAIRGDVGGNNDDLKFLRFTGGNSPSYAGIAMQIQNSTGNVGIGNSTVASTRFAVTGSVVAANIETTSSTAGHEALILNRQNSFGTSIAINKAGSTIGGISVVDSDPTGGGGELLVASGNTGLKFDDQVNYIRPANASGGGRDNIVDLGNSSSRFKDLYLSGGVNFSDASGGTSYSAGNAANTLDDYEEGSWTPTLPNGGSMTINRALYTKIGRQVSVQFYVNSINATNNGSQFQIGGLPFPTTSISNSYSAGSISYSGSDDLSGLGILSVVNGSYLYFHFIDGTSGSSVANNTFRGLLASASAGVMIAEISYFTD